MNVPCAQDPNAQLAACCDHGWDVPPCGIRPFESVHVLQAHDSRHTLHHADQKHQHDQPFPRGVNLEPIQERHRHQQDVDGDNRVQYPAHQDHHGVVDTRCGR